MAEQEKAETKKEAETPLPEKKGVAAKLVPGLIVAAVVIVFATMGFLVGRVFGTRGQAQTAAAAEADPEGETPAKNHKKAEASGHGKTTEADETWYYDTDPVVVNLDEPGVTRYVRLTVTLEIKGAWDQEEGRVALDQKKPLLSHWLTLYLSNQKLEDVRGEKNLVRMQAQICEAINAGLFAGQEPRVQSVLFKEFAIQ